MESRIKPLGHPIHPMRTPFPPGLLSTAVIFDLIALITGSGKRSELAYWMIAAGVVGGLLAAAFGLLDWLALPAGRRAKGANTLLASRVDRVDFIAWCDRYGLAPLPATATVAVHLVALADADKKAGALQRRL